MTEVAPGDRTRLLQSKRAECSAIARSRKRKLCILYEVTVSPDALPRRSFNALDAYEHTPAEKQFLDGCDILQGRTLNELNIPSRPRIPPYYAQHLRPPTTIAAPTAVPNENVAAGAKQPIVDLAKTNVEQLAQSQGTPTTPATASDVQPRPVPQARIPGPAKPTQQASFTASPRNVPTAGIIAPLAMADGGATLRTPQAENAPHKTPLSQHDANSQADGPSLKGTTAIASTTGFLQSTTYSQPSKGSKSTLIPQPKEKQTTQQPPLSTHTSQIDVLPSKIAIPNTSPPSRTSPPDSGRPADTTSTPNPMTQIAASPTVLDVSASIGVHRDNSLHLSRIEASVENKNRNDSALPSHPSQSDRPTPLDGPAGRSAFPQHAGERAAAQQVQNSISAPTRSVASQPIETLPVNIGSPQPGPPHPSAPNTTAPGSGRLGPTINERETFNKTPYDRSTATNVPGGVQQRRHDAIQDKTSKHTAASEGEATKGKGIDVSVKEKQVIREAAQQLTTAASTSVPTPVAGRDQQREIASSLTDVALQKPVAEILGARPQSASDLLSPGDSQATHSVPITPTSQSSKVRPRSLIEKAKARDKSKLPTVVFGKQAHQSNSSRSLVQNRPKPDQLPSDDYYTTLFVNGFAAGTNWMKPLDQLLHQAHKTVSTPDSYTQILDNQASRILRRVYHLQHSEKWSLRQPRRSPEPTRQPCHWDILLQEMKWMRTDFREERKWKRAAARNMAYACAEWVAASVEERKALQVNVAIPPQESKDVDDILMVDASLSHGLESHPTPDLIPSGGTDSPLEPDDEVDDGFSNTIAPSAIFALEDDDIVFSLQPSPATDRLLEELPMYGAPLKVPKSDLTSPEYDPDASWKRPALPLSRFVEGRMELTSNEPPKKRSRYQHVQEDAEDEVQIFGQDRIKSPQLPPQNPAVALFRPENKSIKDRLHAGHQFRPPSDNMPFQAFYESRSSSQWTQAEDDELKSLVREYSYNWSLIFSILSTKSMFVSGADRRTPWECFERWVMLEGLPNDMQKTQYFKLWQSRIEQAQQHIRQQNLAAVQQQQQQQAQQQAQQQQSQQPSQGTPNGPGTPLPRRRHSLPVKVERRRNQKHLTMIDAMRKLAKKREAAAQKQQQAAQLAAARKPADATQPKAPTKTPREYSIMRWERDQAMAERLAERMAQQQRHEAQRRVRASTNAAPNKANVQSQAAIQRAQQTQHAHMAAATQTTGQLPQGTPQMAASHPHAGMARVNNQNHATTNGQPRPRMPMPMVSTPTGSEHQTHITGGLVPPMQMNGSPQIQMPVVNGQAQMSMPAQAHNMHMLMQARRISEQQRQSVQMRQQQHHHQQQQQQQQQPQQPQPLPQQTQSHQQQQPLVQQQSQQPHASQQTSQPLQNSPPAMRAAAINGLNQKSYLNNAQVQAMMAAASFNAANGTGLSTPPAAGFNVTAGQSGSPRPNLIIPPQQHQTYISQLQAIETQIRSNHPEMPQDRLREMARMYLQNRHNSLTQSAMNAAAGSPGQAAAANGPHQYAQLLRAQQQQQQQQAAAAAAAQVQAQAQAQAQAHAQAQAQAQQAQGSQQSAQHHRNSSGSATPTPSITK
ncbi:hypothetical protein F5Y10DRAFT_275421 [Nemania abortiva]|nr:hypothetical protein F5Y10DRAFT_275421 [Nemania abortiva]